MGLIKDKPLKQLLARIALPAAKQRDGWLSLKKEARPLPLSLLTWLGVTLGLALTRVNPNQVDVGRRAAGLGHRAPYL